MKFSLIALTLTVASGTAFAGTGQSQVDFYQDIVKRNAFGLKPYQPLPDPSTNKAPEAPINVEFTGITSSDGVKKAYFRIPDTTKPNMFLFPMIAEGEKEYGIEVMSVNEKDGAVKITHQGSVRTLTFAANGNKASNVGLPAMPPPGGVGKPNPMMPMPNSAVPPPPTVTASASFTPPAMAAAMQPNVISPSGSVTASGARNIPSRPLRSPVTRESEAALVTSMVNIEVAREATREAVAAGEMPPLPPTDFSEMPTGTSK